MVGLADRGTRAGREVSCRDVRIAKHAMCTVLLRMATGTLLAVISFSPRRRRRENQCHPPKKVLPSVGCGWAPNCASCGARRPHPGAVCDRLGWASTSKLSRIELGQSRPDLADIMDLLDVYQVDGPIGTNSSSSPGCGRRARLVEGAR